MAVEKVQEHLFLIWNSTNYAELIPKSDYAQLAEAGLLAKKMLSP